MAYKIFIIHVIDEVYWFFQYGTLIPTERKPIMYRQNSFSIGELLESLKDQYVGRTVEQNKFDLQEYVLTRPPTAMSWSTENLYCKKMSWRNHAGSTHITEIQEVLPKRDREAFAGRIS